MRLRYRIHDGQAALEWDRAVLVFHGLTPEQQRLFHFQGVHQAVPIAGPGFSTVAVTCSTHRGTVDFHSHYADGTNTLRFGGQTVRLTDGGRVVRAGDQAVDVGEGRTLIHLRRAK